MNTELRVARTRRRLSQASLARAAGLSQADVSKIEQGWVPPVDIQEKLAAILEAPRATLFPDSAPAVSS